MTKDELINEVNILKNNIDKIMTSDDLLEIADMYDLATRKLSIVFWSNMERIRKREQIEEQILEESAELEEEYDTDISDCVVNCSTCKNNVEFPPPHTCDICTSLDQEEDYGMWEAKD